MFDNIQNANLQNASEEDVMAAMGGDPTDKTDKKSAGKEKPPKSGNAKTVTSTTPKAVVSDIAKTDLNEAFSDEEDDDTNDDDDQNENDTDNKKKVVKKVAGKTDENQDDDTNDDDDDDDDNQDDDDAEGNDDDDNEEDDDDENKEDEPVAISDFLKARVALLLEKGEWRDFELDGKKPDEIEWTEEAFEEIELEQRAWLKETLKEEVLDTFGPYGRDIAEYAANGGNPELLIDIFKEQQEVKAIDISTEEGQKEMVFQYQTQILKRTKARAEKEIENLIANKMLEDDAKEAKDTIESHLKDEADRLKQEQADEKKAFEQKTKAVQQKFVTDVTQLVNTADDIPADEKKEVIKLLTSFKHKLPNGTEVNDFYFKLADFRKDLRNYVDMVRFVNNPKKFTKSLKNEGKTEEANKSFKIARGSLSKKSAKPTQEIGSNRGVKKSTGFKIL